MGLESLKGVAARVTTGISETATAASAGVAEVSQAATERAIDQMLHALQLAAQRVARHSGLQVPTVHVTANVSLGIVGLTMSIDVPISPPEPGTPESGGSKGDP
jgi:hypothetical protein